jgi:hypothetical protein
MRQATMVSAMDAMQTRTGEVSLRLTLAESSWT